MEFGENWVVLVNGEFGLTTRENRMVYLPDPELMTNANAKPRLDCPIEVHKPGELQGG